MAPPAALAPVGTAVATPAPSAEEQFFAPATLQPIVVRPPADRSSGASAGRPSSAQVGPGLGKWLALAGIVVCMIVAVAAARIGFGGSGANHETPSVLAPRAATAGLPTSLEAIVRIQAESTRRTALQTVEQIGNGNLAALASTQPSYTWLPGDRPSTDSHGVSVAQDGGVVTIAVAASNHDVCAFGQWWTGGTAQYVTMAHEPSCAAVSAPNEGWSSEAGGAASDLPDDNG